MLVDLVQVTTSDGVRLHGALETPAAGGSATSPASWGIDAWLCIHGTGSNFYSASTLGGLAPKLLAGGAAVLRANTRGHDILCTGPARGGKALLGAALERVDEAPLDIQAWLALLAQRGYERVGLLGHSMGAIKSILALAGDDVPPVAALVALSPPRLSYAAFCASPRGAEFQQLLARAEEMVRSGQGDALLFSQFPLPLYISAEGYVDRYGPAEKYNVLGLLGRVRRPTLVTFGSQEVQAHDAFRGMPEAIAELARAPELAVIAGADHQYTACHDVLASVIGRWARSRADA